MTQFLGAGTIASDIVRKETRNGVLATFRLRSGAKGHGQLWIDVETWGHLAGTTHHHGQPGRSVIVAGRLTHKTWHDRATGDACHRHVIMATDIDFLPEGTDIELANTVVAAGTISTVPAARPAGTGTVTTFRLATGHSGAKSGRLWIDVEHWHRAPIELEHRGRVSLTGHLAFGRDLTSNARAYISCVSLTS